MISAVVIPIRTLYLQKIPETQGKVSKNFFNKNSTGPITINFAYKKLNSWELLIKEVT